jgi:hypothetical protein
MHEHRRTVNKGCVIALLILSSTVAEETIAESLPNFDRIASTTDDGEPMAFEDVCKLISYVLYSSHCLGLYEILDGPWCTAIVGSPGIVNIQESKMIAVLVIESSFGFVRLLLSISGPMENTILVSAYHADNAEHLF